jgi:hypothetical protein
MKIGSGKPLPLLVRNNCPVKKFEWKQPYQPMSRIKAFHLLALGWQAKVIWGCETRHAIVLRQRPVNRAAAQEFDCANRICAL